MEQSSSANLKMMNDELNALKRELQSVNSHSKESEISWRIKCDTYLNNEVRMKEDIDVLRDKLFEAKNQNDSLNKDNNDLKVQINNFEERIKEKVNNIIQKYESTVDNIRESYLKEISQLSEK